MAVDGETRNDLRDVLVRYMTGEIRSFAFDDHISPLRCAKTTTDKSVREIADSLWRIYDDFIDHPISVAPKGWEALRRTPAFLQTDLEIETARQDDVWPFRDREQWLQNERLLADIALPPYYSAIHGRPANPWWNRIPSGVGFAILGGLVGAVLLFLALAR